MRTARLASVTSERSQSSRFPVFWAGQSVSIVGSEVTTFALPIVGLLALRASAAEIGYLTTASMAPNVLAPFLAGTLVDRRAKRSLMVACDVFRAAAMVSIPLLFAVHLLAFWMLLCIAFCTGLCGVLFDTAFFVFIPMLVPESALSRANGRIESTRAVARVLGPAIGGALVQTLGPTWAMLIDAGSFLASVATLRMIRVTEDRPMGTQTAVSYRAEVTAGFRSLWGMPAIRLLNLIVGSFNFFSGATTTVTALFIIRILEVSPAVYGACIAFGFVGGIVAGLVSGWFPRHLSARITFVLAIGASSIADPIMAAGQAHAWWLIVVLAGAFFLGSFGLSVYAVVNTTVRQALIPPAERSRVYAAMRVFSRATIPLGAGLGGILATAASPRIALLLAGLGQVAVALALLAYRGILPQEWTGGKL